MTGTALLSAAALLAMPLPALSGPLDSIPLVELERRAAAGLPARPGPPVAADDAIRFERTATLAADGTVVYGCRAADRRDFRDGPDSAPAGRLQR